MEEQLCHQRRQHSIPGLLLSIKAISTFGEDESVVCSM